MKPFEERELNWIFFAEAAKPTSLRRALAERIGQDDRVVIVDLAVSVRRERGILPLRSRVLPLSGNKRLMQYRPLHFPEKMRGMGRFFGALNVKLIQTEIDRLLSPQVDRIVCFDSPAQFRLVGKFNERVSVYLAIDDRTLTVWGDPIPGEAEAETRLLGKVDRVVCVSEPLASTLKSRAPGGKTPPIDVLPNGYDERIFDPAVDYPEPGFLKNVPRPRILIAGHISERIDLGGISQAALLRPDWTWIFLGPADSGMEGRVKSLMNSKALFPQPVSVGEVPSWIFHVDACAVPYRLNAFTRASSPLKAYEYLAMGAPTLATRIPSLERLEGSLRWVTEGDGNSYAAGLDRIEWGRRKIPRASAGLRLQSESLAQRVEGFREILSGSLAS